jgi:NAD kinase
MRYFVSAAERSVADDCTALLADHGYQVIEEYDDDAIVLSIGGDGSILYNSRRFEAPTLLPVAGTGSEANKIAVDNGAVLDRLADVEDGRAGIDYRIDAHRKLEATHGGDPIEDGFDALNDIHLHHANPVRAAKFTARVIDSAGDPGATGATDPEGTVYEADRLIGDGLLVATPFGSTGYYRSITGGTIETGLGVAFNNIHKPADAPRSLALSPTGRIEVELQTTARSSSAVLARDDDPEVYHLDSGEPITIERSERAVGIVRFPEPDPAAND